MNRPPIRFAQLCILVREQMEQLADEGVSRRASGYDAELIERTKKRLVAVGFTYPASPEQLWGAIEAVEHAVKKSRRTD